ncbi:zinc finger protein 77 [Melitaea cinxia]|uniref:zinc finger protein 77 n=1 Tax=Melitaea cinxia TaxID=113334 RepID=UPI001E2711C9|nr:zinc finger protein 77 [Melitaea cinxia]
MLNTVMDLTGSADSDYPERSVTPEKILPDLDDNNHSLSGGCTQPSKTSSDSLASSSFSVLKNTSNAQHREMSAKSTIVENKLDAEFSDSCPVPDLICNEKPSISPCSELSEQDNSSDRLIISSPRPESSQSYHSPINNINIEKIPPKPTRHNPLRLNNIFVKKHKKILQIKNSKAFSQFTTKLTEQEPRASSSSSKTLEEIAINKTPGVIEKCDAKGKLQTVSIEKIEHNNEDENEFDANTEVQSMDIEPVTPSNVNHSSQYSNTVDMVQVKEEINSSNEFSNGTDRSTDIAPMETLRPINVVNYGNMAGEFDDDSNHRELLDLEAASKNKQFVSMMNENYFGDNIYADYFTPDRVEAFEAEKVSHYAKENGKDGMYIWGESSQKESEFVLPNFIHESYKIAESTGIDYSDMGTGAEHMDADVDRCERDSKADMYSGIPPAEPYDLMARESWVSDGSDVDSNEKTENVIEEEIHFPKSRTYTCAQCGVKFPSLKELRGHKALVHAATTSSSKTSYSRLMTARTIKKEEKQDDLLPGGLLSLDTKEGMASTMLQVYNAMSETKPHIEGLIKQETRKRRKDFVCPTCKVDQLSDAAFHAHLKEHPLECLTCGKCFFKRANLALHVKTHLGIRNYKCEVCEKRFLTRQKLAEHHNVHTGRAPVKCTLCDDTFRRYSNMVQHRDRHHFKKKTKVRDFVCQCGAVFHSRAKLLWHKETHDDKPKACVYCSDKFVHAASLTRHIRRTHNELFLADRPDRTDRGRAENVPCPVCKQIYLRSNLRAHLLTHSGKRPYHCVICNKAFTTKWNLKLHRWTHLSRSAKPFKCNLCKGAFIRHTDYVSHMNAHKSVRPYTCNYCGCQFIRKYNCQRHVREHEMAKKYVCKVPECGKSFHRSYYLSEHMKVHSGARPFSCNICGKTSSNKSNHNKHVKIHHAREPIATEA